MTDFDRRAATWDDDPSKVARANVVADAIRARVPLGPATSALEFGAGTGLVGLGLQPHLGRLVLADASRGMLDVARAKIARGNIRGVETVEADDPALLAPQGPFDLVLTVMTLHHVRDVAGFLATFHALVAPGGHVCIADLEEEDGSFHGDGFDGHNGFAREPLRRMLESAGFAGVAIETIHEIVREGDHGPRRYPVFLAVAQRRDG